MRMRKFQPFCASMHQHVPYGTKQDLNNGSNLAMSVSERRMRSYQLCTIARQT